MREKSQRFENFRLSLPDCIQNEVFRWGGTIYEVPQALYLVKVHKLQLDSLDVKAWCEVLGMAGPKGEIGSRNIVTGVNDDEALLDKVNPDIPLVIVEHTWGRGKKKESTPLLIDGNKRLRKAFLTGREKLSCYYLPEKLAKKIKR